MELPCAEVFVCSRWYRGRILPSGFPVIGVKAGNRLYRTRDDILEEDKKSTRIVIEIAQITSCVLTLREIHLLSRSEKVRAISQYRGIGGVFLKSPVEPPPEHALKSCLGMEDMYSRRGNEL